MPVDRLPSVALRIAPAAAGLNAAQIARRLRQLPVPVIARVHDGAVWLDLRCLEDKEGFAAQLRGRTLDRGP